MAAVGEFFTATNAEIYAISIAVKRVPLASLVLEIWMIICHPRVPSWLRKFQQKIGNLKTTVTGEFSTVSCAEFYALSIAVNRVPVATLVLEGRSDFSADFGSSVSPEKWLRVLVILGSVDLHLLETPSVLMR
jgi:hypothetical protein